MGKGKKRTQSQVFQKPRAETEYDVARSMQRVRPYRSNKNNLITRDASKYSERQEGNNYLSNQSDSLNQNTSEPIRDFYFRLEDQMSDYFTKNEDAHNRLRKELDTKISSLQESVDGKVSNNIFQWVIGGLATAVIIIVTIWFLLSYSPLIEKTDSHTDSIHDLDKRVHTIESTPTSPHQ